jgi:hypothetical protein
MTRLRRGLVLAVVLLGGLTLAGCSSGSRAPGPAAKTSPQTVRAEAATGIPAGWRWEAFRDVELGVPGDWGYGTSGTPWCLQDTPPAQAYVGRPGPIRTIRCTAKTVDGIDPGARITTAGTFVWFEDADEAEANGPALSEGDRQTVTARGVRVSIQAPQPLRQQIAGTIRWGAGDPATRAADAFRALAEGEDGTKMAWGQQVSYYIGSSRVAQLTPEELPGALRSCPPGTTSYEERTCPVSPLRTVAEMAETAENGPGVVIEPGAPAVVGCSEVALPRGSGGLNNATIRPPAQHRDCFGDFAVTFFTDDKGTVKAIQFTLSSP